ncbi:MAG: transposase [Deltaproteobacteria bacterium]|nr:transposase [Deltaproteobacteria bacterium]
MGLDFRSRGFHRFVISQKRACSVLEAVLGSGYSGVLGSDFCGAYTLFNKKCSGVVMRLCWAHLIRSLKTRPRTISATGDCTGSGCWN